MPRWSVHYTVFAQAADGRLPLAEIVRNAARWFDASIDVESEHGFDPQGSAPTSTRVRLTLDSAKYAHRGSFDVVTRPSTPDDRWAAESAEAAGRASGMALLAARCAFAWEIEPLGDVGNSALLHLCAVLASVALGPVMPSDRSTLLGVKGSLKLVQDPRP